MQLSLFDAGEYYQFPTELLDYTEHFCLRKEQQKLKKISLKPFLGNRIRKKCLIEKFSRHA